jgi:glutaminase
MGPQISEKFYSKPVMGPQISEKFLIQSVIKILSLVLAVLHTAIRQN